MSRRTGWRIVPGLVILHLVLATSAFAAGRWATRVAPKGPVLAAGGVAGGVGPIRQVPAGHGLGAVLRRLKTAVISATTAAPLCLVGCAPEPPHALNEPARLEVAPAHAVNAPPDLSAHEETLNEAPLATIEHKDNDGTTVVVHHHHYAAWYFLYSYGLTNGLFQAATPTRGVAVEDWDRAAKAYKDENLAQQRTLKERPTLTDPDRAKLAQLESGYARVDEAQRSLKEHPSVRDAKPGMTVNLVSQTKPTPIGYFSTPLTGRLLTPMAPENITIKGRPATGAKAGTGDTHATSGHAAETTHAAPTARGAGGTPKIRMKLR